MDWPGPVEVISVNDKVVSIRNASSNRIHNFSKQDIKPYCRPNSDDDSFNTLHEILTHFRTDPLQGNELSNINLTEEIKSSDPRVELFANANSKELKGLTEKRTWKVIKKDDIPSYANILNGRFVLTITNAGSNDEFYKARFVVQGYRDKLKTSLVHDSTSAKPCGTLTSV